MLQDQSRYYRLDLNPEDVNNGKKKYVRHNIHHWSPKRVFAEDDLYSVQWGDVTNTEIEQFFFGQIDGTSISALDYFTNFTHPSADGDLFQDFTRYMSVQKLRTPKGLKSLSNMASVEQGPLNLMLLQRFHHVYCAIWTECVWQIADASDSPTKFIISDHPVTVYNRSCPILSKECLGHSDPDIRMHATHTYFPLSLDKVLILTNLSWVRNPYQNGKRFRPNPNYLRDTFFNFLDIQTDRKLSEDEVLQINLITKQRAYRYIAAAKKEWLFPEVKVSTERWQKLGGGYLLMPEPRLVHIGGQVVIGYEGGGSDAFSEYGHKPWDEGYKDEAREIRERDTLERFKAEWAIKNGPIHTAKNSEFGSESIVEDSETMTKHYRSMVKKYKNRR